MNRAIGALVAALLVAGCSGAGVTRSPARSPAPLSPTPSPVASLWSDFYNLHVSNATALTLVVVVNGEDVGRVGGGETALSANDLPPFPWSVDLTTTSGRSLVRLSEVDPANVWRTTAPDGHSESRSAGNRVDLSCGRIDVWVGAPLLGPAPGPGQTGDCNP